jgi:hypothetical protein
MDLLITMIGNAVVDAFFRKKLLENPIAAMDEYQFRLTKGDFEMMTGAFAGLKPDERKELERLFSAIEDKLYQRVSQQLTRPCTHPCAWSAYPTKNLRTEAEAFFAELRAKRKAAA